MGSKGTPFDSPGHGRHGLRGRFRSPSTSLREKPDFVTFHLLVTKLGPLISPCVKLCSPSSWFQSTESSPDTSHFVGPPNLSIPVLQDALSRPIRLFHAGLSISTLLARETLLVPPNYPSRQMVPNPFQLLSCLFFSFHQLVSASLYLK